AKNVATMSGDDFNALFRPMKDRGGIIEFDKDKSDLDPNDITMIDQVFADQKGASWFFVVSRASPEGSVEHNRDLSKARAESVMRHVQEGFKDPDLDKEVACSGSARSSRNYRPSSAPGSGVPPAPSAHLRSSTGARSSHGSTVSSDLRARARGLR